MEIIEIGSNLAQTINLKTLLPVMMLFILVLLLYCAFSFLFSLISGTSTKSGRYRKLVTDLYVVGIIRQYAEKDGVNLNVELAEMRRLERLEKLRLKELDEVVEEQLKEMVNKKTEEIVQSKK